MADQSPKPDTVSRRRFVKTVGVTGTVAGIAGCSGNTSQNENGGTTSTTSSDENSGGGKTVIQFASDPDLKEIQPKFNQWLHEAGLSKDIEVEILAGSNITNKRQSKYNRWLSAGRSQPSILMMDSGWTIPFIARNYLLNLSKAIPDTAKMVKEEYFQASVDTALGRQDNLFAIPMFPDFPTMQYRKDLVEKHGYDPEGESWATKSMSWKRFSEITKDVKEKEGLDYGFTFQFQVYEGLSCCDFNEFLSSFGGGYFGPLKNLFGPVGDRPITVGEQPVVDSLKMLRTFIHGSDAPNTLNDVTGKIAPEAVLQWSEEPSRKPFTNGNAVMHRNWPYSININGKEKNFGKGLGVMPIPYREAATQTGAYGAGAPPYEGTSNPNGSVAALGGWHAAVNPNTKKKESALAVMKAMTSKNVQYGLLEELGWLPPRPPMLESDRASQIPAMGRYMKQLRTAGENAIPRPVTVVWPQESSQIAQEANAAVAGEKSPQEAMTSLKSALKQIEQSV